jgi:hypothetical protein
MCSYALSMGVEGGAAHRPHGHIFGTLNHWFIGQVIDTKCIYVLLACINVAIFGQVARAKAAIYQSQNTKQTELKFRVLLTDGAPEVRFERVAF